MDHLSIPSHANSAKKKALEAGRKMQNRIIEDSNRENRTPPKYVLNELIGRGNFGLVYKGHDVTTAEIVAVKIIDIDESDLASPRYADTYSEFLKEVGALKQLRESEAQNINHVIDALAVGTTLWLVTEYCGGGSVATLMKPTAPGGLDEKWIIPILRETAEAIKWVHDAGIIHRDIKCANILITEQGDVKLCDFGVAATVESSLQKRSTFTGTPHWMAPELFDSKRSYGKEVDIWAFGAMIHEIATGFPPNVQNGISYLNLGSHLQTNAPSLEGKNLSTGLQNLGASCLEMLPSNRPSIEQIQEHTYLFNSDTAYPTSSLSELIAAYHIWEQKGNGRQSLINGSELPGKPQMASEEWVFTTSTAVDERRAGEIPEQAPTKTKNKELTITRPPPSGSLKQIQLPTAPQHKSLSSRRPTLQSPLEQAFDPEIELNYDENSQRYYSPPPASSDFGLAVPSQSMKLSSADSLIDLGDFDTEIVLPSNLAGLKIDISLDQQPKLSGEGGAASATIEDGRHEEAGNENNPNMFRCSDDWKLPPAEEQLILNPSVSVTKGEVFGLSIPPGSPSSGRPSLKHHPTDPTGMQMKDEDDFFSGRDSLIDLNLATPHIPCQSYPRVVPEPSSLNSDTHFESTAQIEADIGEPSVNAHHNHNRTEIYILAEPQELLADIPRATPHDPTSHTPQTNHPRPPFHVLSAQPFSFPDLPDPPSKDALMGQLSKADVAKEVSRMFDGLQEQLVAFQSVYHNVADVMRRRDTVTPGGRERRDIIYEEE